MNQTFTIAGNSNPLSGHGVTPRYVVWSLFLIGCALLLYTGIRAATVAFTFDEIYSLRYIRSGFHLYPDEYGHMSANHHWLNSFCVWILSHVSTSNFVLRLPQLFAHAFFLLFSARILLLLRKDLFTVAAFILVNVHPYLLDFFSLARGYGLSLGCMMPALFFLLSMANSGVNTFRISAAIFFAALAVTASFVMLNFFLAMAALTGVFILLAKAPVKYKVAHLTLLIVSSAGLLLLVVPHLLKMRAEDALFFGSTEFWNGTVKSLTDRFMYRSAWSGEDPFAAVQPILYVMVTAIVLALPFMAWKKSMRYALCSITGCVTLLLFIIIILFVVQSSLFGTLYPLERTGIFLFILFLFAFVGAVHELVPRPSIINGIAVALCLPLLFHFVYCANTAYVLDWKEAANTDQLFAAIEKDRATRFPGQDVLLSSDPVSGYSTEYIAEKNNATWLHVYLHWYASQLPLGNYYLVEKNSRAHNDMSKEVLLYEDEITGNQLFAGTAPVPDSLIQQ